MKGLEIKGRLDRIGKTPLEHFQDIKELEVADEQGKTVEDLLPYKCERVEKSLTEYEAIKNAEPSEALNCLDKILGYFGKAQIETMTLSKCNILTIKQALLQGEKDRKAIELLKKGFKFEFDENIDIGGLMYIKSSNKKNVVTKHYDKEQLDLLKQVIEVEE